MPSLLPHGRMRILTNGQISDVDMHPNFLKIERQDFNQCQFRFYFFSFFVKGYYYFGKWDYKVLSI